MFDEAETSSDAVINLDYRVQGLAPGYMLLSTYSTMSRTVLRFGISSSDTETPKFSSIAMRISTTSRESAPRSYITLVSSVMSAWSARSWDAMISAILSNIVVPPKIPDVLPE